MAFIQSVGDQTSHHRAVAQVVGQLNTLHGAGCRAVDQGGWIQRHRLTAKQDVSGGLKKDVGGGQIHVTQFGAHGDLA